MATVTVVTADRTLEIEASSIVDGEINAAGHLILTRHDGTPLDMGAVSGMQMHDGVTYAKVDAFSYIGDVDPGAVPNGSVWYDTENVAGPFSSETQQGLVELASNAETLAGTDNTRAVTPAGLASIPGNKVQILTANANTESALPSAYPSGISLMSLTTGSGWSLSSGLASVVTNKVETDRTSQMLYSNPGATGTPRVWTRHHHSAAGGWSPWAQFQTVVTLTPASFAQTTLFSSYPVGLSRLYYTTANSSSWDFAGSAGEVVTFVDGSDFAKQTWMLHASGSGVAETWIRTANAASGWTAWRKIITDPGVWTAWTPTWSTSSGTATPSLGNATVDCKYTKRGRKVDCRFEITFGSTTNFGSSPTTGDNWQFSLPVPVADANASLGFIELRLSNDKTCMGRAKAYATTGFRLSISSGFTDGSVMGPTGTGNTGDVDSLSPFTWTNGSSVKGHFTYESAS